MDTREGIIPWTDCKDGTLYRIASPYARVGVYRSDHECFLVVCQKHGHDYLVEEYHEDLVPGLGVIRPLQELGPSAVSARYDSDAGYLKLLRYLLAHEAAANSLYGGATAAA